MSEEELALSSLEPFDVALGELENHFREFISAEGASVKSTASQLPLLQGATYHANLAYSLGSLFFMYLRLKGVDPHTHPVSKELDRVKTYFGKIKSASKKKSNNSNDSGSSSTTSSKITPQKRSLASESTPKKSKKVKLT